MFIRSYDSEEERLLARRQAACAGAAARAQAAAQAEMLAVFRARQQLRKQLEEDALQAKMQQQRQQQNQEWADRGGWRGSGDRDAAEGRGSAKQHPSSASGTGSSGSCFADGRPTSEAQARVWLRAVQQHERLWAALEEGGTAAGGSTSNSSSRTLAYVDVPWPTLGFREYLAGLAVLEQQEWQHQQQRHQQRPYAQGPPTQGPQVLQVRSSQQQPLQGAGSWQRAQRRAYTRACLRWHPDKFEARWGRQLAEADRAGILARVQELSQGINAAWEDMQAQVTGRRP